MMILELNSYWVRINMLLPCRFYIRYHKYFTLAQMCARVAPRIKDDDTTSVYLSNI